MYRRTEFIVATCGDERALVQVEREDEDGILVGVRDARILARPDEVAFVDDESVDTGNASQLARVAKDRRVTVVQGRFQHVNFIYEPAPLRIRVLEVVPPHPPKLLEMAQAVLDFDEDLPPVALDFEAIDMRELAREHPAGHYLFPCRCAGLDLDARGRLPRRRPAARRRLDAGRLRALAADPRGALRRRPARSASTSARG